MKTERLGAILDQLRESMWLIPAFFTVLTILLAFGSVAIDRAIQPVGMTGWFLFHAGPDGARGVLGTIAGSIITVTGVVFSITIVALQLASTQFTPRVLRSFLEDRAVQVVLALFIATFTYALLVLRTVRDADGGVPEFVPVLSVTLALGLALASVGGFIYFLNHIAHSMQVETIMERVVNDVLARIEVLFPERLGQPAVSGPGDREVSWQRPPGRPYELRIQRGGYLQHIEVERILKLVETHDLRFEMTVAVGSFLIGGDPVALVWPYDKSAESQSALLGCFHIGSERTLYQDVARGLIELTDIALRSLSPSLNDPTTAVTCIYRITEILKPLAERAFPTPVRAGADGVPRLLTIRPSFDEIISIPYSQIRVYGASHPVIVRTLIESLGRVGAQTFSDRAEPIIRELHELLDAARREIGSAYDLEQIEAAGRRVLDRISQPDGG